MSPLRRATRFLKLPFRVVPHTEFTRLGNAFQHPNENAKFVCSNFIRGAGTRLKAVTDKFEELDKGDGWGKGKVNADLDGMVSYARRAATDCVDAGTVGLGLAWVDRIEVSTCPHSGGEWFDFDTTPGVEPMGAVTGGHATLKEWLHFGCQLVEHTTAKGLGMESSPPKVGTELVPADLALTPEMVATIGGKMGVDGLTAEGRATIDKHLLWIYYSGLFCMTTVVLEADGPKTEGYTSREEVIESLNFYAGMVIKSMMILQSIQMNPLPVHDYMMEYFVPGKVPVYAKQEG